MIRIILISLISLSNYSQCKYEKDEIDPFTKKHIIKTKHEVFAFVDYRINVIRVQGVKVDNQRFLKVWIVMKDSFILAEKDNLMLLSDNEEVITLPFEKSISSDYNNLYYNSGWYVTNLFKLSEEFYNVLKFGKFKMARVETTKGYVDFNISNSNKDSLQKVLQCIY
ncbi:hypothetical protein [Formosa maritima]|uniref:Uncharacterized protein n=1 Tax=Formosa maritima TaxID=2592046 RepID=A0A5D0GIU5_9FLAO|nr:hypothetical protein [Formosa maritima]TYA58894.1 hypothetical protein FVF61_01735 [Formosa maritima]